MEETISLKELLQTLKKRLALILAITLTAVIVSGVVSFLFNANLPGVDTDSHNQKNDDQSMYSSGQVQTNLQLINTYNEIIKSNRILTIVADEVSVGLTAEQLKNKITVTNQNQSQLINITVQDEDPNTAASIANTVANVFAKEIVNIMNVDNVSILANATVTDGQAPVKPQPILNIAIALVVGLMAGVGLAFLIEYLDNTVKDEQDVERQLELPILGVISVIDDKAMEEIKLGRSARKMKAGGETVGSSEKTETFNRTA